MGEIVEINGPIVTIRLPSVLTGEQVRVGELNLIGEVIGREEELAIVQVYETTDGLRPGEEAEALGHPLSVELGPGMLGQIFDGVQRPLQNIMAISGDRIARGLDVPALPRDKKWPFQPNPELAVGARLQGGEILGSVQETAAIAHRILVPPETRGDLLDLAPVGEYTVEEVIARVQDARGGIHKLKLYHRWPVRRPRPYLQRDDGISPLITGQRVIDTFFPQLKGGKGAVPGPFGAGKTVVQQQIARWSNADIVIYVGCGERGNELVDVLETFPELDRPLHRAQAHGAHPAGGQYLQHAGGGARGLGLCRHDHGRVLPRHGLRRGDAGGLHQPLGRGPARGLRAGSGRCRSRKATRPISPRAWRRSTSAPAASRPTAAAPARSP